jgi:Cu2+-exporting ATPase
MVALFIAPPGNHKHDIMEHDHHHHKSHRHSHTGVNSETHRELNKPAHHHHVDSHHANHYHRKNQSSDHDQHAGHHTADFLKRFWICVAVTIPVLLLSPMVQHWLNVDWRFPGDMYLLLALSSFIYFYGGWPFLAGLVREIRYSNIGMMTLVAVAITAAYVYSVAIVFGLSGMDFFWELATLIDIMLLGHWLEMRSQTAASKALESLVALMPTVVHVQKDGRVVDLPLQELKHNDVALVKPGEKIPADGIIKDGSSYVNESMLTGESVPVKKEKQQKVIGGSINGDGSLKIQITGTGKDSYLNKVITMVQSAQDAKSKTQNLANRVAKWLTIASLTIGIITFFIWYYKSPDLSFALERMVTVMVTACPHALGVAIPLVAAISTSISATNGLLIRNRTAFENARNISTIIFDKTGTLTQGSHELKRIIPLNGNYSEEMILQYAASVQQHSEHHIAKGVMKKFNGMNLELFPSSSFSYMQGIGVTANVNGKRVVAAGPNYFREKNIAAPETPSAIDQDVETINYVFIDDEPVGIITFADSIREGSAKAVRRLKDMNIKSFLLTGDNERIAASVSKTLGMDGYLANVLPHEKQQKVQEFQAKGEVVAMTGDGVNDAPALAQADVGIAVGSGTDVAAETADIILVNSDPEDIVNMIAFGKATYRKMLQNLYWATGYNIIAIPLAAGLFYPGFVLSPAMGAILMSLSTVVVAVNAQLLRKSL